MGNGRKHSLVYFNSQSCRPDDAVFDKLKSKSYVPMSELDEMSRMGWGSTPQTRIPEDWRTRMGPHKEKDDEPELIDEENNVTL
jgi:hypothetical protein